MNTYNWQVTNMDCYPSAEGETDVVYKVYYYVEAFSSETHEVENADGTKNTIPYQATTCGEQALAYTGKTPYTPYSQLTNNQVIGWVQNALGDAEVNALLLKLDSMILDQINPPVVNPPLPWSN
jgi:hypothetical protein